MRKDKHGSFASQHKVECEHVRNAPSSCIQAWWMWGLPRTEATKSRDGRANGTGGLEWARHMCKESKQHHSTFSSAFSTSGEFPKIPQAIFRRFFIKTKSGFSSLRWLGYKWECFHWARLLLGRCHELWTCAISNQNWRFSDRLGIAGYKVVQQMTVCSSANSNAADRWENDSENDAAACSSSWNQTCLCTSLLPNTYDQNTEKNFSFVISWSFIYVCVFASTGKIKVHSMLHMQGWNIAGVSTKVNKRCS